MGIVWTVTTDFVISALPKPSGSWLGLLAGLLVGAAAQAGTLVDLSAEASRPAANDMVRASVYSEASGKNPGELAQRVNADVVEALRVIRAKPGVSVKTGQQASYPVYGEERKLEGWRMRSELILESADQGGISELLGKLQQMRMAVGNVSLMPSPETRRRVEDEAMREAIRVFRQRAALISDELGRKPWKIKQLNVQQNGAMPPRPMMMSSRAGVAADAAPMPLEAGESLVTTSVSGQIEVAD